jgi:hypothetical protein
MNTPPTPPRRSNRFGQIDWQSGGIRGLGPVFNGHRHGRWNFWYPDGTLWQCGAFQHGLATGTWESYLPNGDLEYQVIFEAGRYEGDIVAWHHNHVPSAVGSYRDNERHGRWRWYDDTGVLLQEGNYECGKRDGVWRRFNDDGTLLQLVTYERGVRHGAFVIAAAPGDFAAVGEFEHDEIASAIDPQYAATPNFKLTLVGARWRGDDLPIPDCDAPDVPCDSPDLPHVSTGIVDLMLDQINDFRGFVTPTSNPNDDQEE